MTAEPKSIGQDAAPGTQVTETRSHPRLVPALLVVLGILLLASVPVIRTQLTTDARTTVSSPQRPRVRQEPQTATVTSVQKGPPAEALIALIAAGSAFVLAGAFYARVRKITIGDKSIELGDERIPDALGKAMGGRTVQALASSGALRDPLSEDELRKLLERVAAETASIQQRLIVQTVPTPPIVNTATILPALTPPHRRSRIGAVPIELLDSLSQSAAEEIAAEAKDQGDDQSGGATPSGSAI